MTAELPIIYTQGSINQLPLMEALMEEYRFVVGNTVIANTAKDMGMEIAVMEDAFDPTLMDQVKLKTLWLQQRIMEELSSGSLVSLDPDVEALRPPALQQWFPNITFDTIHAAILRLRAFERIIEEHGIAGVLVHDDVTIEGRSLVAIGEHHGVPTLHIPHANHFIQPNTNDIHTVTRAANLGVAGNYMYNWYKTAGVDPERMTKIGSPQLDEVYRDAERLDQPHARRCFGLDEDGIVLLYATSWAQQTDAWGRGQEDLFEGTKWFLETAKQNNAQVILKLHPHEGEQNAVRYKEMAESSGLYSVLTSHYLPYTLSACDVVVTQGSSNLAIEAGIFGKPTVEMFQPGTKYPEQYNIPGSWGPDLGEKIKIAWEQGVSEDFLADMNVGPGSTERASDWVRGKFSDNDRE
jgi:hypothetical protein